MVEFTKDWRKSFTEMNNYINQVREMRSLCRAPQAGRWRDQIDEEPIELRRGL